MFGVGYDVNIRLLDKMAIDNGGTRNYVEPHEDIEAAVSSLFRKMNEPVLVDVKTQLWRDYYERVVTDKSSRYVS